MILEYISKWWTSALFHGLLQSQKYNIWKQYDDKSPYEAETRNHALAFSILY